MGFWFVGTLIALKIGEVSEVKFMKNLKCENCGSEMVLNHFNYCECVECGKRFVEDLDQWFFFYRY